MLGLLILDAVVTDACETVDEIIEVNREIRDIKRDYRRKRCQETLELAEDVIDILTPPFFW